ncbi:hypothetical protein DCAR_0518484 [Daucus carota subsp. sativus]|uniref:KIB1-4 beta-propeller domain-containing protein n=1 Tax=Daucus carota subsp. sativus TaxID=79200 RepID=A0AAF1B093_DAUCS|nr:hypothetical protein DCAR_0518484 [Daucus carota subsp. sativus]
MAVYGELSYLGFARLGDSVWTDVHVPCRNFQDIAYHNGNFYAVNFNGDVYVCSIDDDNKEGHRGMKVASIETYDCDQKYLVEPLSGSGLLVLVRYRQTRHFIEPCGIVAKYRTTHFAVWRLDLTNYDSLENPSYTLTEENSLGNEAIIVGRAASLSVPSSETIRPNSIYFTDDNRECYLNRGGGHDMGIFDMERRTIEPHFQGNSLHCISPPLWYI